MEKAQVKQFLIFLYKKYHPQVEPMLSQYPEIIPNTLYVPSILKLLSLLEEFLLIYIIWFIFHAFKICFSFNFALDMLERIIWI